MASCRLSPTHRPICHHGNPPARYFASIVEHGSIGKAALELGMVTSA
jgi:hypothetical protein